MQLFSNDILKLLWIRYDLRYRQDFLARFTQLIKEYFELLLLQWVNIRLRLKLHHYLPRKVVLIHQLFTYL